MRQQNHIKNKQNNYRSIKVDLFCKILPWKVDVRDKKYLSLLQKKLFLKNNHSFFLGGFNDMPAIYSFAINAGFAIIIDFLMQLTVFVSLMTLDMARQESNRYDIACCIKVYETQIEFASNCNFKFKYFLGAQGEQGHGGSQQEDPASCQVLCISKKERNT